MDDIMTIARRHLAALRGGEKGEKGEKVSPEGGFSPLNPLFHPPCSEEEQSTPSLATWEYQAEACRLMEAADALVERLGVDGRHPEIAQAAAIVGSALAMRDIEMLRTWVFEFELVAKRIDDLRSKQNDTRTETIPR